MEQGKEIVRKNNQLINARYSFSVTESRLILKVLTLINKDDEEFKTFTVNIKDFVNITKHKGQKEYDRVKNIVDTLCKRTIHIPMEDGFLHTSWLSSARYFNPQGTVEISIDEKLKPYLLQLKSCFTRYELENVLALKNTYSFRIFELLKQYQSVGKREIDLEKLKTILQVEKKYKLYNDFRRYVLLRSQKDLKKNTDIFFEFTPVKQGRKVTKIIFTIFENPAYKPTTTQIFSEDSKAEKHLSMEEKQIQELTKMFNKKAKPYLIGEETLIKLIEKFKPTYEELHTLIFNLDFESTNTGSFLPIETLINSLKGSYIPRDRKAEHEAKQAEIEAKEKQRQKEAQMRKQRQEEQEEADHLDRIFNCLSEEAKTCLKTQARIMVEEEEAEQLAKMTNTSMKETFLRLFVDLKVKYLVKVLNLQEQ